MIAIPGVGRMRLMMDPQGAAFYIIEPASSEQRPEREPEIGDASWHELMTTDITAAMKFTRKSSGGCPARPWTWAPVASPRSSTGREETAESAAS